MTTSGGDDGSAKWRQGEIDETEWMKGGSNEASSCSDGDVRRGKGGLFPKRRERSDAGGEEAAKRL